MSCFVAFDVFGRQRIVFLGLAAMTALEKEKAYDKEDNDDTGNASCNGARVGRAAIIRLTGGWNRWRCRSIL